MKEHYNKKVNVLGVDVSVLSPNQAVSLSRELMSEKGLRTIFFLSAEGSLYGESHAAELERMKECHLVLTGDAHIEEATTKLTKEQIRTDGITHFTDQYFEELFQNLSRHRNHIFVVMQRQEDLDALGQYVNEKYPHIIFEGILFNEKVEGDADRVVNEMNAVIPDMVFLCLPIAEQMIFLKDYCPMMNASVCVFIDSLELLIRKATTSVPAWTERFHLKRFYMWWSKERKLQKRIMASIFKRRIQDDTTD